MSKELDALERLTDDVLDIRHYYKQFSSSEPVILQDKELIAAALKRNEDLEKELSFVKTMEDLTIEAIKDKRLKTLKIIKEKEVNVGYLKYHFEKGNGGYREYERVMTTPYLDYYPSSKMLTREEFDLLKEVLWYYYE